MQYLIDGYNLLFCLIDSNKTLQSQRQIIIRSLQQEFAFLNLEGTIVFDGSGVRGEQSGLSYESPLTIAYSFAGETADQSILEKIETFSRPSELVVVSNDKVLGAAARRRGAQVMNLKAFIVFLQKKHAKKKSVKQGRPATETKQEFERLLKIFEDRLEDSDPL